MRRGSSRSSPKGVSGFTLIELLLALAIAAVVVTTVNFAFFNTHAHIEAIQQRREVYQTARIVLDRMVKDLTCAYIPYTSQPLRLETLRLWRFKGLHDESGGRDTDSLTFTTAADIGLSPFPGSVREVSYYLKEDDTNKGTYTLMRREDPSPDTEESTGGVAMEVAQGVSGLKIVYLDEYGQESPRWELEESLRLPAQVRITLTLGSGEEAVSFTATASLPLSWIKMELSQE